LSDKIAVILVVESLVVEVFRLGVGGSGDLRGDVEAWFSALD